MATGRFALIMKMKITIHEDEPPVDVPNISMLDEAINSASEEAYSEGLMNIIIKVADNGNWLGLVVGGAETVLSFNYGHGDPPYYASQGGAESDEPVLTAHLSLKHHIEFPRNQVISMDEGLSAAHEFFDTCELPKCISWTEV
jgi:hypothetical protein